MRLAARAEVDRGKSPSFVSLIIIQHKLHHFLQNMMHHIIFMSHGFGMLLALLELYFGLIDGLTGLIGALNGQGSFAIIWITRQLEHGPAQEERDVLGTCESIGSCSSCRCLGIVSGC